MSAFYHVLQPQGLEGITEMVRGVTGESKGGHADHWHCDWQIVAVTGGDGWVRTYGEKHRTPGGSLFLVPPELVHSNDVFEGGCAFRSMLLRHETVKEILEASGLEMRRTRIGQSPVLISDGQTGNFSRCHDELENDRDPQLADELLAGVVRSMVKTQTGQEEGMVRGIHPAAMKAREFLWERAPEKLSLAALAREAGLSRFELSRQFSAAFGMSPHAWQLQARIEWSKPLLKKGVPLGEVALRLGFSDQAHFSRIFKRATRYTPGRFAREFRKNVQD